VFEIFVLMLYISGQQGRCKTRLHKFLRSEYGPSAFFYWIRFIYRCCQL